MPGLRLTVRQAARLFGVTAEVAEVVLEELRRASILARSDEGVFALISEPSRRRTPGLSAAVTASWTDNMSKPIDTATVADGALREVSVDRLACLLRHWTWADEARARFEQELAAGWDFDEDLAADHPFGAYYHWCALLCGFSEAALEQGLLSALRLGAIRRDLEASLAGLRACRQLLVVIPASLEAQPRIVDLLRDEEMLGRLRRIHSAFGEALREERMSREIDSLDH
jgi:hypothetical protein